MRMHTAAKTQKLRKAVRELMPPKAKARQLVREVIVIEGPAWHIAFLTRSSAVAYKSVWSMALQMTNISSTPIPISKKGSKL